MPAQATFPDLLRDLNPKATQWIDHLAARPAGVAGDPCVQD
jgi:hypothetical protein